MGALFILMTAILGLVVDYSTTGLGIMDTYGLAAAIVGLLAIQLGQLFSMVALRTWTLKPAAKWGLVAMLVLTSAINVFFNIAAMISASSVQEVFRFLTSVSGLPDLINRAALVALSFAITTEFENALVTLRVAPGAVSLSASAIPIYLSLPRFAYAAFRGAIGNAPERKGDPRLFAIPLGALAILAFRAVDVYSSYQITFEPVSYTHLTLPTNREV